MLWIANKQLPEPGDYNKEQQGFLFTITFRGSLTMSRNTQEALHVWLKRQSALGRLEKDSEAWVCLPCLTKVARAADTDLSWNDTEFTWKKQKTKNNLIWQEKTRQ